MGGGERYLRTEKLKSFHLQPFIVLTITKRAHYKAERVRAGVGVRVRSRVRVRNRVRVLPGGDHGVRVRVR